MVSGIKHSKDKIEKILQDYKYTNSIYQTAKKNKIHYLTAKKYINQYIHNIKPIDGRSLFPKLKGTPDNKILDNIYNNKDIKLNDNNVSKKDTAIALNNNKPTVTKEDYLINSINKLLTKLINRYKKEYKEIPIKSLYLHFGTLFDKLKILTDEDKFNPDSQVVINFYGNEDKVRSMINKIRSSKTKYMKDITNG